MSDTQTQATPAQSTPDTTTSAQTVTPTAANEPQKSEATVEPSILGSAKALESKEAKTEVKTQVAAAPEKYTDFKLPEGTELDKAQLDKALPMFKELKLSQEQAQKLVSFQAESVKASHEATLKNYQTTVEGWKQETIKTLGSDAERELGFVGKALDAFGSPELRQLLDQTGFGNHPLLAKMLVAIGKAMSEDRVIEGDRHGVTDPATELKLQMFPSMKDMILNGNKK